MKKYNYTKKEIFKMVVPGAIILIFGIIVSCGIRIYGNTVISNINAEKDLMDESGDYYEYYDQFKEIVCANSTALDGTDDKFMKEQYAAWKSNKGYMDILIDDSGELVQERWDSDENLCNGFEPGIYVADNTVGITVQLSPIQEDGILSALITTPFYSDDPTNVSTFETTEMNWILFTQVDDVTYESNDRSYDSAIYPSDQIKWIYSPMIDSGKLQLTTVDGQIYTLRKIYSYPNYSIKIDIN